MSKFRFLKRTEIDDEKWNALISNALNSLPYAFTWYLDIVAENWGALVYDNYTAVMPLVWLRKLGVKCVYQPYFCQQLGIFSAGALDKQAGSEFIILATGRFKYIDINLNPRAAPIATSFSLKPKKNLFLNLDSNYLQLYNQYSTHLKRNLKKTVQTELKFSETTELKVFQKFYLENIDAKKQNFKPKHSKIFKSLSAALVANQTGKIFSATDSDGNLQASALIIFHQRRMIGIINTSSERGKKMAAMHFLFNKLIHKFSGQGWILDFEGSSIPGVARFYESFGAQPEIFYNYHYNVIKNAAKWFK